MKVYVERNALRSWLRALKQQGRIQLLLFPYDGQNPSGVEVATPSLVTCDSTWVTFDMMFRIKEGLGSEKFEAIRQLLWHENEKKVEAPTGRLGTKTEGDARHLDSAYKSGCRAFFTADKTDILARADQLEALLGLRCFHPDEQDRFLKFLGAS
jgi:hypothetical protein